MPRLSRLLSERFCKIHILNYLKTNTMKKLLLLLMLVSMFSYGQNNEQPKQSFKYYTPREKPPKRGPRQHKKNLNKNEKRQKKMKRYKGQG